MGVVGCVAGLAWRQSRLAGLDLLDGRGWYTPEDAADLFDALDRLDASARAVYAATALTIDMVFPASYGLLLAVLLFRLFRGGARCICCRWRSPWPMCWRTSPSRRWR